MEQTPSFSEQIDQLIRLFNKYREQISQNQINETEKQIFANFDQLLNQYQLIKSQLPADYINSVGQPFAAMIKEMIGQLKAQIGDDFMHADVPPKIIPVQTIPAEKENTENALREIEQKLKVADNESEINVLLDQRAKLLEKK